MDCGLQRWSTSAKATTRKQPNKVEEEIWLGRQKTNFYMITTRME